MPIAPQSSAIGYAEGEQFCKQQNLRLCSAVELGLVCTKALGAKRTFPLENNGSLNAGACSEDNRQAQVNAGDATLICCSTAAAAIERKLLGPSRDPVLPSGAVTASSFLNNERSHGYGYHGMNTLRSDNAASAWCAASSLSTEWVQLAFPRLSIVSKVAIYPGSSLNGSVGRLQSFFVEYRRSATASFERWRADSSSDPYVFGAFRDIEATAASVNITLPNIRALEIRFVPASWLGVACVRLELFGPAPGSCILDVVRGCVGLRTDQPCIDNVYVRWRQSSSWAQCALSTLMLATHCASSCSKTNDQPVFPFIL